MRYRMYGLVAYQLSGTIHAGIQYGHAVIEYGLKKQGESNNFLDWAENDKTFIILNGGTTNDNQGRLGSLNTHLETLKSMGIKVATFHEPDLGDQLTAVVFLVDERVWDEEKYPSPDLKMMDTWGTYIDNMGGEEVWGMRQFLKQFKLA